MVLWINHLSKMTVANGGRTDQKEFAYLKECFKKPMARLGLSAVVLYSKHKFYNTPMERERWRLVEIRLASALSAMLKTSIPPAHSGLRIQIQCVEHNIADKHDSVISGRQLIRLMMDHFESSTALTSKFLYQAISHLVQAQIKVRILYFLAFVYLCLKFLDMS